MQIEVRSPYQFVAIRFASRLELGCFQLRCNEPIDLVACPVKARRRYLRLDNRLHGPPLAVFIRQPVAVLANDHRFIATGPRCPQLDPLFQHRNVFLGKLSLWRHFIRFVPHGTDQQTFLGLSGHDRRVFRFTPLEHGRKANRAEVLLSGFQRRDTPGSAGQAAAERAFRRISVPQPRYDQPHRSHRTAQLQATDCPQDKGA